MLQGMLRMSIAAAVALGGAAAAMADDSADLQARVAQLEAQLAQVQQTQGDTWMNERRAEEIKGLIHEVLSDADTRASLLQDGLTAGHDGKNFFLKSNDGAFVLKVAGQIQLRAIWDFQSDREDEVSQDDDFDDTAADVTVEDEDDFGFQVRRAKIKFFGNVPGSQIDYLLTLATDRGTSDGTPEDGNVYMEDIVIGRAINDNWYISGGKQKLPFLREELTSSSRLLAVERGLVTEFFTLDRAEGVQFDYDNNDNFRASLAFSDGADSETSDFGMDEVEIAITARGDLRLMGDWDAIKDQTAWQGQDDALFVGGAIHWQLGDGNNADYSTSAVADYFAWTIDGSYENGGGLSASAAVVGGHMDPDTAGVTDRDMYGLQLSGAYNIDDQWQPFLRWEWIDQDLAAGLDDELQALTFGVNRYVRGHNVKITADILWVYDGDVGSNPFGNSISSSGLGFSSSSTSPDDEDIIVLRTQVQVLF